MGDDIVPEAYCDALFIGADAPRSLLPMSVIEMHLFSYLGCILALFRGNAVNDWQYSYAITNEGFPFSADFEAARRHLVQSGFFDSDENGHSQPHDSLYPEIEAMISIGNWRTRRGAIRSAMECALALPVGAIRYAIRQTPGMALASELQQRRRLLDSDDISLLYNEYKVVNSILGAGAEDVLSPAVLWLSARIIRNEEPALGAA